MGIGEQENKQFESGAVRSSDAEDTRFDLITPIGLQRAALAVNRLEKQSMLFDAISATMDNIYLFLSGDREVDALGMAAGYSLLAAHYHHCSENKINDEYKSSREQSKGYAGLAPYGIHAVAEAAAEGAVKYSDFNWERGMDVPDLLNHAIRHYVLFLGSDRTEPHLGHAAWGILAACHSDEMWPKLNKGKLRLEGCKPPPLDGLADDLKKHKKKKRKG